MPFTLIFDTITPPQRVYAPLRRHADTRTRLRRFRRLRHMLEREARLPTMLPRRAACRRA